MNNKTYRIEKSPLYRLRNRRKLALLLNLEENYFKKQHKYEYHEFYKFKSDGKGKRFFSVPPKELKKIQQRICILLSRIETPEWVKSGKKNESYITNAKEHINQPVMKTMDISHFYDSVNYRLVFHMFKETFCMSDDIAIILTKLVTFKQMLPTGSPSSQQVAYWTFKDMFQEINELAKLNGCIFTLYVDDMTFSSQKLIPKSFRNQVASILKKNQLMAKEQKDHHYDKNRLKRTTGVGIRNGKLVVLNKRRKEIIEQFKLCKETDDIEKIEKLNGMFQSIRQIEPDIFPSICAYLNHNKERLKELSKIRNISENKRYKYELFVNSCNS